MIDNEEEDWIIKGECITILHQAINAFYVAHELHGISKTAYISNRNIFFNTFLHTINKPLHAQLHEGSKKLLDLLHSWNLKGFEVPKDGNCLFMSVAYSLLHRITHGDKLLLQRLVTLGIETDQLNATSLQQLLRELMVKEWMANIEYYQPFAVGTDLLSEAGTYLISGQFAGTLGDLMVTTLSNLLNCPIA